MINGILNIYKEKGFTSHDVVAKLRGILKQKKIGHTGTLDPDARGVLPVCLGKGTKVCDLLTDKDKTYEAKLLLGVVTDTQDTSGNVLQEKNVDVTEEKVTEVIESFIGEGEQIPPMYSALKVNGKKLYELARAGIEVERKPRKVTFHKIQILKMDLPEVVIEVTCSKGTYIRTLCHDIGAKLGCGGCMKELLRTRVDIFDIEHSYRLSEIQELAVRKEIEEIVLPVDELFRKYQKVTVKKEMDKLVHNGNALQKQDCMMCGFGDEASIRVYDSMEQFIGIYQWNAQRKLYVPRKMFWETKG